MLALAVGSSAAFFSLASPAAAQDAAAAQQLFDEGRALVLEGKTEAACPKFEESFRLDPHSGTKFNLADCYEVIGRTATAWTLFLEVASESKALGRDERERVARERAAVLAPKLSRLTINVPESSRVPGLSVVRTGTAVGPAQWGSAVPVDPGTHSIRAAADGYRDWTSTIEVGAGASSATIDVPRLEPLGVASSEDQSTKLPSSAEEPREHPRCTQCLAAFGVGGLGVVALGVGGYFGIRAVSGASDAKSAGCHGNVCPDAASAHDYDDARSAGTAATVLFAVGGVAVAAGAVLYLTRPRPHTETSGQKLAVGFAGNYAFAKGEW